MFGFRLIADFTAAVAAKRGFYKIKSPCRDSFCRLRYALPVEGGGARRDRTADLLHAMQALSQLSYGPNSLETCRPQI